MLDRYLRRLEKAKTHDEIKVAVVELLSELGADPVRVENHRIDVLAGAVVVEVKRKLPREMGRGKEQLRAYLERVRGALPRGTEPVGVITDGHEWHIFSPDLSPIQSVNAKDPNFLDALRRLPLRLEKPSPEPREIALELSELYRRELFPRMRELWGRARHSTAALGEWRRMMRIVYGEELGDEVFIMHTFITTVAKLLVAADLGVRVWDPETVRRVVSGSLFRERGVRIIEGKDFFSWVLEPEVYGDFFSDVVSGVLDVLHRYDLSRLGADFFKELYESLLSRDERRRLGEYYTPLWLAREVVRDALELSGKEEPRILDPACGSGTFLEAAIEALWPRIPGSPEERARRVTELVVGIDLNPVAAIIARAVYVRAIRRMGGTIVGPLLIPVYNADSLFSPERKFTLEGEVHELELQEGEKMRIPAAAVRGGIEVRKLAEALAEAVDDYERRKDRKMALGILRGSLRELEMEDLANYERLEEDVLDPILNLVDKGKNGIWTYIIGNSLAVPVMEREKFDIVVGNPPWVTLRTIKSKDYQEKLKDLLKKYGIYAGGKYAATAEIATAFVASAMDRYLRKNGILAFVLTRSVLVGSKQHQKFQKKYVAEKGILIYDLEKIDVFRGQSKPACVIFFGKKIRPERRIQLKVYHFNKYNELVYMSKMYEIPKLPKRNEWSYYHRMFRKGAEIYPRPFYFIEFLRDRTSVNIKAPLVRSAAYNRAKKPWGDVSLRGNVERDFIFACVISRNLEKFGLRKFEPIVLPVRIGENGEFEVLPSWRLIEEGFKGVGRWFEKAEEIWTKHLPTNADKYANYVTFKYSEKEKGRATLYGNLNYQNKLKKQGNMKRYLVVYNESGKRIKATVIDTQKEISFKIIKGIKIKARGIVVEHNCYWYSTDSEDEAYYLVSVLNSEELWNKIKGFLSERHITKRPFEVPVPEFNPGDPRHLFLAAYGKYRSGLLGKKEVLRLKRKFGISGRSLDEAAENAIKALLKPKSVGGPVV